MFRGMINDIAFGETSEKVRKILKHIDVVSSKAQEEAQEEADLAAYVTLSKNNNLYKIVFRVLMEYYGIYEQTKTFYALKDEENEDVSYI